MELIYLVYASPMTEIRKGGSVPCHLGNHSKNVPKAFDFSVEVCNEICKNYAVLILKMLFNNGKNMVIRIF